MRVSKICIYCNTEFTLESSYPSNGFGVCPICTRQIELSESPDKERRLMEWQANRDEINNLRRI